jgi:hypothetical protein
MGTAAARGNEQVLMQMQGKGSQCPHRRRVLQADDSLLQGFGGTGRLAFEGYFPGIRLSAQGILASIRL